MYRNGIVRRRPELKMASQAATLGPAASAVGLRRAVGLWSLILGAFFPRNFSITSTHCPRNSDNSDQLEQGTDCYLNSPAGWPDS